MDTITDLDTYLQDISPESPQGVDMKYSMEYTAIREASREDLDLPQGVWVQDLKSADWEKVQELCITILKTQSKDIQIAAWLIEAWMSLYGMRGLRQGFQLLLKMSQKYWDIAYPTVNPEDPEYRGSPYNWINEKLSERLNKIYITYPEDPDLLTYSFYQYLEVHREEEVKVQGAIPDHPDRGWSVSDFKASLRKTPDSFFQTFLEDLQETKAIVKTLQAFLDSKISQEGPSLYRIRDSLDTFELFIKKILAERGPKDIPQEEAEQAGLVSDLPLEAKATPSPPAPARIEGLISNRAEAYAIIETAAHALEKLDPHSPASYLIKRAVKWGNLSFTDLLKEVVQDPSLLQQLKLLFGVKGEDLGKDPQAPPAPFPRGEN
jgi:type VI secretion system protein ImpA